MKAIACICSLALLATLIACSNSSSDVPSAPTAPGLTSDLSHSLQSLPSGHQLLGLFDIAIDQSGNLETVPLRSSQWHFNAITFIESPGKNSLLSFSNIEIIGRRVNLDVTIEHPFHGFPDFVGFDVKGIVIGPGDMTDKTDPSLAWAGGPEGLRLLNADGWTRWWNPSEFPDNGTVFSFTPGRYGLPSVPDGSFNSTIQPFKVFANSLGVDTPLYHVLEKPVDHPIGRGTLLSSSSSTRHYALVFPGNEDGGLDFRFNYAVDVSHAFPEGHKIGEYIEVPDDFPLSANQPEPFIVDVNIPNNTVYISNQGCVGGSIDLKIRVSDWQALITDVPVSTHVKRVELRSPTLFVGVREPELTYDSSSIVPWATYEITLSGLTPDSVYDQQILLTVVSAEGDYQKDVTSYAGDSELATYFVIRVPVTQSVEIGNSKFDLNPLSVWPKEGGDRYNRFLSKGAGPENPSKVWSVGDLWIDAVPVIGPEKRIFVSRLLPAGGIELDVVDLDGLIVGDRHFAWLEPEGNPVVVGCSLLWNDTSGQVIQIDQDGGVETIYNANTGTGPGVFNSLTFNNVEQGFIYGPAGINAFTEEGVEVWSLLGLSTQLSLYLGAPSITPDGSVLAGRLDLSDNGSLFEFVKVEPVNGDQVWSHVPQDPSVASYNISVDPLYSQLYYTVKNKLVALSDGNGEERWSWSSWTWLTGTVAVNNNGEIIVGETLPGGTTSTEGQIFDVKAFDKDGNILWSYPNSQPVTAAPVVDLEGNVYFGDGDGLVHALDNQGIEKWVFDVDREPHYLIPGPDGTLLIGIKEVDIETTMICLKD
ncbi:MAG TPA: PQQ-binding-like beta-propeller repeat protein [bacterium]|jgi:hypothetical protein